MSISRRTRHRTLALASGLLPMGIAGAQDPIIKSAPTVSLTRLPAPSGFTARQIASDRILLTWRPVDGAASYALWRSVPPAGIVSLPVRPTDTLFIDASGVSPGSTYYYNVAAVDTLGMVGLRAGTNPVAVTTMAPAAASSLTAALSEDGKSVALSAVGVPCDGSTYLFERADATKLAFTAVAQRSICPANTLDNLVGVAAGARLRWRVLVRDRNGAISAPTLSNELTVGTSTTTATTGGTTGPTTSTPTAPATGSTTFTVAPALSLTVGVSASLASLGGTRWVSMSEAVATVDASGAVTGRAPGTTQIVSLTVASDGSLRVATVRITVQ